MPQTLYYIDGSPPCLAVNLVAEILGVKLNLKFVDMEKGEHLTPEFLKLNPMHQVPILDDNGFVMVESRAILQYLVTAYGKAEHENLYPKDAKKRYLVDKILYFDLATLYASFADLYYPMVILKAKFDPEKFKKINENLGYLNGFLETGPYAAGDQITIADLALVSSLACMQTVHEDIKKYPNIVKYINRCEKDIKIFKQLSQKVINDYSSWAKPGVAAAMAQ